MKASSPERHQKKKKTSRLIAASGIKYLACRLRKNPITLIKLAWTFSWAGLLKVGGEIELEGILLTDPEISSRRSSSPHCKNRWVAVTSTSRNNQTLEGCFALNGSKQLFS